MRKASVMLSIALCAASPLVLAQSDGTSADSSPPAVAATVRMQSADATAERTPSTPRSAFGRVMALLTQVLQEAGTRPAGSDAGSARAAFADAGVIVTVTPIDGRSAFAPPAPADEATPASAADADAATDAPTGTGAQLAVQAEGDGAG